MIPVDARSSSADVEKLVRHTYADDGANHGVRTGSWETQPPGAEIPQNGGNEQRKHHREAGAGTDLEDEIDREKRDHREGYGTR